MKIMGSLKKSESNYLLLFDCGYYSCYKFGIISWFNFNKAFRVQVYKQLERRNRSHPPLVPTLRCENEVGWGVNGYDRLDGSA